MNVACLLSKFLHKTIKLCVSDVKTYKRVHEGDCVWDNIQHVMIFLWWESIILKVWISFTGFEDCITPETYFVQCIWYINPKKIMFEYRILRPEKDNKSPEGNANIKRTNEQKPNKSHRDKKNNVKFLKIKSSQLLLHKLFWIDVYLCLTFLFSSFTSVCTFVFLHTY